VSSASRYVDISAFFRHIILTSRPDRHILEHVDK
jgi:hypothetical protein